MYDQDGPRVARAIYRAIFEKYDSTDGASTVNFGVIPYALDAVVREMRDEGLPPNRWAQFVYFGM